MSKHSVSLEQITGLPRPESSYDLPENELYIQLGCSSCSSQVCFVAKGLASEIPQRSNHPKRAKDLNNCIQGVQRVTKLRRGSLKVNGTPCPTERCLEEDNIQEAVEALNEQFGSGLTVARSD